MEIPSGDMEDKIDMKTFIKDHVARGYILQNKGPFDDESRLVLTDDRILKMFKIDIMKIEDEKSLTIKSRGVLDMRVHCTLFNRYGNSKIVNANCTHYNGYIYLYDIVLDRSIDHTHGVWLGQCYSLE